MAVRREQLERGRGDDDTDLPVAVLQSLGDNPSRRGQISVHHDGGLPHGTAIGEPHAYRQYRDDRHDQPRHQIEAQAVPAV